MIGAEPWPAYCEMAIRAGLGKARAVFKTALFQDFVLGAD